MASDTDGILLHSHPESRQDSALRLSEHEAVPIVELLDILNGEEGHPKAASDTIGIVSLSGAEPRPASIGRASEFEAVSIVEPVNVLHDEEENEALIPGSSRTRSQTEKGNESPTRTASGPSSRDETMKNKSRKAPILMLSTLLCASVLAIIHDRMNHSLNGHIVNSNGLWSQQWTSRYGTALAFLTRMFFVMCVGCAFVQRQWFNLSTRQQVIRVRNLDILSNALSTPLSVATTSVWIDNPLLLVIVLISWTLPFATVVTPGTLSVEPRSLTNTEGQSSLRLETSRNGQIYTLDNPTQTLDNTGPTYATPSFALSKLAIVVVTTSKVLPMVSMYANQTFCIKFSGPALKCQDANSSIYTKISHLNTDNAFLEYLAWVGNTAPWLTNENPVMQDESPILPMSMLQNYTFDASSPDILNYTIASETESIETLWVMSHNDTVSPVQHFNIKECQLWNASYAINFTSNNFQQNASLYELDYQNPITSISTRNISRFNEAIFATGFHKAVLSSFASLLVGAKLEHPKEAYQISLATSLALFDLGDSGQLNESIQGAFQNLVLSLFSVPHFFARNNDMMSTNVTSWASTYVYQPRDLILAYAISFSVSLLCCIIGLHSFWRNGSSFQNSFSTYVRAVQNSSLDVRAVIRLGDTGADPLPDEIGRMKIKMKSA